MSSNQSVLRRATAWVGAVASVLLAACSSVELPTTPQSLNAPTPSWEQNPTPGYVRVCKVSGPAGSYTFAISVQGGGSYDLNWGPTLTLDFDGVNPICLGAYHPVVDATWTDGMTAQVTVTELVPANMSVEQIDVYDPDVASTDPTKPFGYQYSLYDTPTATVTVTLTGKKKLNFYNIENPPPPPPVVATCYAVTAVAGVPIEPTQLGASGGEGGPYTFTATGLPDGLTLSTDGVLSGTPTVSGNFTYTITVTDNSGNTGSSSCAVNVAPPPVVATCYSINAMAGIAITPVQLTASGGTGGPYTFSATGLPAGLTVSTSGLLSGTPTVSGNFTYTITVTDNSGNSGSSSCSVTVGDQPPPPPSGEGCTPGYWKAKNHWDSWVPTGYSTNQKINTVFTVPASLTLKNKNLGMYTMIQGLSFQGGSTTSGKAEILLRAAIAGVLNAAHPDLDYEGYTPATLIAAVNEALASLNGATMVALAAKIDELNNRGCTLN